MPPEPDEQPRIRRRADAIIDYPRPREMIRADRYTFRIATPEPVDSVQVSVDGGEWAPCRSAVGFWWHDWRAEAGRHRLSVRLLRKDGSVALGATRSFRAAPEGVEIPVGRRKHAHAPAA